MAKNNTYYNEIKQPLFEQVERYINNEMSKSELAEFENQLQNDSKLQNEVNLQRNLQMALAIKAMGEKYNTQKAPKKTKVFSLKKVVLIAASVTILFTSVYFLFTQKQTDLFKAYYQPDSGLPTVMGLTSNYTFQDAMVDYKMEKYQKAKNKWQKMAVTIKENDTLNYYIAMADLNLNKYNEANVNMNKIPKNSVFYKKVLWYQALIAVRHKKYSVAKTKLQQLNTKQAQELLNKIPD